jgi:1,4-dihydroxy-2-naphthoate octaprenyltransferase
VLYAALLVVAVAAVIVAAFAHVTALLALLSFVLARPLLRVVFSGARGPELIPVLAGTGRLELVYAALLTLGLALSRAFA